MIFAIGSNTNTMFSLDADAQTVSVIGPGNNQTFTVSPSQFDTINSGDIGAIRKFISGHIQSDESFLPPTITSKNLSHLQAMHINLWNYVTLSSDNMDIFDELSVHYAVKLFEREDYTLTPTSLMDGTGNHFIKVTCTKTGDEYGTLKIDFDDIYDTSEPKFQYIFTMSSGLNVELKANDLQDAITTLSIKFKVSSDMIRSMEQFPLGEERISRAPDQPELKVALFGGPGCGVSSELLEILSEKHRGITVVTTTEDELSRDLFPPIGGLSLESQMNLIKRCRLDELGITDLRGPKEPNYPIAGQRRKKGKNRYALPPR